MADADQPDCTTLTVQLLTACVSNNMVPIDHLPGLIERTQAMLAKRTETVPVEEAPEERFTPAISMRKSLASPEHIVSMIDGKPYRVVKRHRSTPGLTPAGYRARYKLPADYPMVAPAYSPAYSEARRESAKRLGLGRKLGQTVFSASPPPAVETPGIASAAKPRRRKVAEATAN